MTTAPAVPTKTPLGQEELRARTQRLGQRYRTVLLLIDGRRTLGEVLGLAQKAGSTASHFEDLVRMGLVEMPLMDEAPPVEAPAAMAPDVPHVRIVELPVLMDPLTIQPHMEPAELQAALEDLAPPPVIEPAVEPAPAPVPEPVVAAPVAAPKPAPRSPAAKAAARRRAAAAKPPAAPVPPVVLPVLDTELVLEGTLEDRVLEQSRTHLVEMLKIDAPTHANRLLARARDAKTIAELIDLVWAIERGVKRVKRSHEGQLRLEAARDLLGLGNTQVAEDTQPGYWD